MATTLLGALRLSAPKALALLSPKQHISLTYGELDDQVLRLILTVTFTLTVTKP
jgi:hypothetical protein